MPRRGVRKPCKFCKIDDYWHGGSTSLKPESSLSSGRWRDMYRVMKTSSRGRPWVISGIISVPAGYNPNAIVPPVSGFNRIWTDRRMRLHRRDGPSVERSNGKKEWWHHGDRIWIQPLNFY